MCCGKVVQEDIAVCLHKDRILKPNYLACKGKTREETTIPVNWVMDGIDHCSVVFLPQAYALNGAINSGLLCQATEVFAKNDSSCAICKKRYKNKGFAHAMVVSLLKGSILSKGGETVAMGG